MTIFNGGTSPEMLAHTALELTAAALALVASAGFAARYRVAMPTGTLLFGRIACLLGAMMTVAHGVGSALSPTLFNVWVPLTWTIERTVTLSLWIAAVLASSTRWSPRHVVVLIAALLPLTILTVVTTGYLAHPLVEEMGRIARPGDFLLFLAAAPAAWWAHSRRCRAPKDSDLHAVSAGALWLLASTCFITGIWGTPLSSAFFLAHAVKILEWGLVCARVVPGVPTAPSPAIAQRLGTELEADLARLRTWAAQQTDETSEHGRHG